MSDADIRRVTIDRNARPTGETDWAYVDSMTDEEALQNARDDPDNPPLEDYPEGTLKRAFRPQWLRRRLEMSQKEFAEAFGFPLRSLQQWEQGRSTPGKTIQSYFRVIALEPDVVRRALTMRPSEYHAARREEQGR
jgi:putative transcriptional regulator